VNLVESWEKTGASCGRRLIPIDGNHCLEGGVPRDAHGYVMTYACMGFDPSTHATIVGKRPTMVIIDEIHHLADDDTSRWGTSAKTALKEAKFRLALSGTPYRSSSQRIPFVTYVALDGESNVYELKPDYNYSYGQAVAEGVCRDVVFHPYPGNIKFRLNGNDHDMTFDDEARGPLVYERLRGANTVSESNELLIKMIRDANDRLMSIRDGCQSNAAGIIIANDLPHAKELSVMLKNITGHRATIVLSEDEEAHNKIKEFRKAEKPWMVAVRMVSEGVDIPRFRLMVYLSQITEELFFTQALGRIVRSDGVNSGPSHFYMPADERLLEIAKKIEGEIKYALEERNKKTRGEGDGDGSEKTEREFIGADGYQTDNIVGGKVFSHELISLSESLRPDYPELSNLTAARFALFVQKVRKPSEVKTEETAVKSEVTYADKRKQLRAWINTSVRACCSKVDESNQKAAYRDTYKRLYVIAGTRNMNAATLEQLELMRSTAEGWVGKKSSSTDQLVFEGEEGEQDCEYTLL
jgi:superfamily II DNA or RNA helicase